jgi:hypothetical protein
MILPLTELVCVVSDALTVTSIEKCLVEKKMAQKLCSKIHNSAV